MSHVRIDTSVRTHHKFLQAGPAASWLWACANMYSQDALSDGFIPFDALNYLGVKSARTLVSKLVKATLFDEVPGGWRIHDYLKHNKTADEIRKLQGERRTSGSRGGSTPRGGAKAEALASANSEAVPKQTGKPYVAVVVPAAVDAPCSSEGSTRETTNYDVEFTQLQAAYGHQGVNGSPMAMQTFKAARESGVSLQTMLDALDNHHASQQWTMSKVPNMLRWLTEKKWNERLPKFLAATGTEGRGRTGAPPRGKYDGITEGE